MSKSYWSRRATLAAQWCAKRGQFTADDVWQRLRQLRVELPDHVDGRMMGAVLIALKKDGQIEPTGEYRRSVIPAYHAHPRSVWRAARVRA